MYLKQAALIGGLSLLSRVLGVIRDHLLAGKFGALTASGIYNLDSYYAAFRLPDLLYNLLILGTIGAAFVPIFREYITKKNLKEAFAYTNNLLNLLFLSAFAVVLMLELTAPLLVRVIAPGFSPELTQHTLNLTRIMLISPMIFSISAIFQSLQNAFSTFFYFSLAPIFYNLGIIIGIYFLSEPFGVYGVAMGVLLGALLHLLIQIPGIIRINWRYAWTLNYRRPDIVQTIKLLGPRVLGLGAAQFALLVDTGIASTLAVGSIALFNYAINLQSLPIGVLGISVSLVAFSLLSDAASQNDWKTFQKRLYESSFEILRLIIPATVGMIVLRNEIVTLILKSGKFTLTDVEITSSLLAILSLGLFAQSLIPLFARAFYAHKNTKTPVICSLIAMAINIVLSLTFVYLWELDIFGIAWANIISSAINFALLYIFMQKKLNTTLIDQKKMFPILIATVIMTISIYTTKTILNPAAFLPINLIGQLLSLSIIIAVGLISYLLVLKLFIKSFRSNANF